MMCERCSEETFRAEKCAYCSRNICRSCLKSLKRIGKIRRTAICKDCWSDTKKRKRFKSS